MSKYLKELVNNTPVGDIVRENINRQVTYIKSLPFEAWERVNEIHEQSVQLVAEGNRSSILFEKIMRTGDVAASSARMIGRTEVSRASTAIIQARAVNIGSEGYIWRTSKDGDVRHSHKKMEGIFVKWDTPPTLDGMTGHAGCLPYCRCYTEIVLPRYYDKEI